MKKVIASLLLAFSFNAHAADISLLSFVPGAVYQWAINLDATKEEKELPYAKTVASGYGDTCDEALTSAKIKALENVNGAWIHGDSYVRNNLFTEKITQYQGGVIKSYKYLRNDCTFVIIEAEVVPRSNKVQRNDANLPQSLKQHLNGQLEEQKRLQQALKVIDDRSKALAFTPANVQLVPENGKVKVVLDGWVTIQEKWAADYKDLTKLAGKLDLQSFYKDLKVSVDGVDSGRVITNSTFTFYDELRVYSATTNGVIIRPKHTDMVRLQFFIEEHKLKNIDKFEVKFI